MAGQNSEAQIHSTCGDDERDACRLRGTRTKVRLWSISSSHSLVGPMVRTDSEGFELEFNPTPEVMNCQDQTPALRGNIARLGPSHA